jgi:hypothetical protein
MRGIGHIVRGVPNAFVEAASSIEFGVERINDDVDLAALGNEQK